MKITYCKEGVVVADHKAERYALKVRKKNLRVANELVIHYARTLIAEGILENDIDFEYEVDGVVMYSQRADSNGRFKDWPEGFCDHIDNCLGRLF